MPRLCGAPARLLRSARSWDDVLPALHPRGRSALTAPGAARAQEKRADRSWNRPQRSRPDDQNRPADCTRAPRHYTDKSLRGSNVPPERAQRPGLAKAPATEGGGHDEGASNVPQARRAKRLVGTHSELSETERARLPKHVKRCFNGTGQVWYAVYTWNPLDPRKKTRSPYSCASWRCPGACARYEASVTFARIKQALERPEYSAQGWVVAVLTLDRDGYYSGKPWSSADEAYRALGEMTRMFLQALRREQWRAYANPKLELARAGWKRRGYRGEELRQVMKEEREALRVLVKLEPGAVLRNEWLAVVEAHRTGWPHMNIAFYAPELAEALERTRLAALAAGKTARESTLLGAYVVDGRRPLRDFAVRAKWGPQSTAERIRDRDALAGYVTKLAATSGGISSGLVGDKRAAAGEVSKITQAPRVAPERFRRLRSGRGFLPPRYESGMTGSIIKRIYEYDGTIRAQPVHATPAALIPHVTACCYHEEELAIAEMAARKHAAAHPGERAMLELIHALTGRTIDPAKAGGLPPLVSSFLDLKNSTGPPRDTS